MVFLLKNKYENHIDDKSIKMLFLAKIVFVEKANRRYVAFM